ncbi:tyrosine-type recombinase/integrase [Bradyrhizobium sp. USDA 4454]
MLALSRKADRPCRQLRGRPGPDRPPGAATRGQIYPDRPLHRHQGRGNRGGIALPRAWTLVRRSRAWYLLPKADREASHQEASDASPAPTRLLAHLRRWQDRKLINTCFVEFNGKPVASVKKGFKSAVDLARLPGKVTPHTLRHTAATWLMQRGVPTWEAAGFLGMSAEGPAGNLWPSPSRSFAWGRGSHWPESAVCFAGQIGG